MLCCSSVSVSSSSMPSGASRALRVCLPDLSKFLPILMVTRLAVDKSDRNVWTSPQYPRAGSMNASSGNSECMLNWLLASSF